MGLYPQLDACNLTWNESLDGRIASRTLPRLVLTKQGMANYEGNHADEYAEWLGWHWVKARWVPDPVVFPIE